MIAQWDSSLSAPPPRGLGSIPSHGGVFQGFFPGWSPSANPSWASVAENGSISPQWHNTNFGQWGGRPKSNHGQTMADEKKNTVWCASLRSGIDQLAITLAVRCTQLLSITHFTHLVTAYELVCRWLTRLQDLNSQSVGLKASQTRSID